MSSKELRNLSLPASLHVLMAETLLPKPITGKECIFLRQVSLGLGMGPTFPKAHGFLEKCKY